MQIIRIYDGKCDLRWQNKNVFRTTERFLKKYPEEYKRLYDKNLQTLTLWRCDELLNKSLDGEYYLDSNIITYIANSALGHELFHVASYDSEKDQLAFGGNLGIGEGLLEGMTEYLFMKAFDLDGPGSYVLEVFAVAMLSDMPDLFKHFFIPDHNGFINIFPNRKEIYNLLLSVDSYNKEYLDLISGDKDREDSVDMNDFRKHIRQIFDNLISIELSVEKDSKKLKEFRNKFMDLLETPYIRYTINQFYPRYCAYAEKQLRERILKR